MFGGPCCVIYLCHGLCLLCDSTSSCHAQLPLSPRSGMRCDPTAKYAIGQLLADGLWKWPVLVFTPSVLH